ncbi:O-antigen ligase family protein [Dyella sp. EPa41]|uniref:O-antigen ligase family protein n=1 Tax=Dyella sp. EPa41 TaxID=1561194 RepID=UPI001915C480|nr:O-antigen ligase family protein [Dyella sp. EPa41]
MRVVPPATAAERRIAPLVSTLLLALLPLSFATPGRAKVALVGVLFFYGLYLLIANRQARAIYRGARPVTWLCWALVLFAAANILGHGLRWNEFDLPSHILLFLGITAVFTQPLRLAWFWRGLSMAAAVLGLVCIYQHYFQGAERASGIDGGDWGVIELAMFMLVLSLSGVVQLLRPQLAMPERVFHAGCAALGMFGALLTQSRGPLLACAPVFALVIGCSIYRTRQWRAPLVVLAGAVLVASGAVLLMRGEIVARFDAIGHEVRTYSSNDTQGAVRERLEMWRVATRAFAEHPVAGVGIDQFGKYTQSQMKLGLASDSIAKYEHPHSEYLEAAVAGGVPGLILLLLLFGMPLVLFARRVFDPDDAVAVSAMVGLLTVAMYALCGLTDNVLYRSMPHSLFFFLVLGMTVQISRLRATGA